MSEELKIEKPGAELYKGKRKLFCISLLYSEPEAPEEYLELIDTYWTQVDDQVQKMEKAGKISTIYHEAIYSAGAEGLKELEKLNEKSYALVKRKCDEGTALEALEDRDLFFEFMDWKRCMLLPFTSQNVMNKVFEFYRAASTKRYDFLAHRIDETLEEDAAGLLIMNDEDRSTISFPQDIEVFIVHPPALTDIQRWIREQVRREAET